MWEGGLAPDSNRLACVGHSDHAANRMAYDEVLDQRVRRFFEKRRVRYEAKRMMGGLCFMVKGKMCVGVETNRLMARIGPDSYDDALTRKGCRPMEFTGRPMRGFVFVMLDALRSDKALASWLELALAYNPTAKTSAGKKRAKTAA
jgi:TfoX/Sxy family transcriptional regulator of competence genes